MNVDEGQLGIDFDAAAAAAAREKAIDRVEAGSAEWQEEALRAVEQLARRKPELTTDDLWRALAPPAEPRAAGAVMRRAVRERLIERSSSST